MISVLSDDQLGAVHLLLDRIRARQLQDFGQIGSDVKPDGSLITDCDRWSDAALVEGLACATSSPRYPTWLISMPSAMTSPWSLG